MAATGTPTPNIGLRIPLGTDPASVDDINYNSNLLDTKLGPVGSDSVQDQIDTLNGKFTSQIVTISPDSNGTFVMDIDYSTFVSMSCSDASNYLCFVRKSASNKCIVFSYDDVMNKMTSGSYNARVWTRVP